MRSALIVALLVLLPTASHAADKIKARELYRVGTQHYNLAEYDKALDSFKEAYRNYEDPIFLFNIGQCHRQLDHKQEAVGFYRAYLRNAPNAPNRDEVNALIAKLESAIAEENATKRMPPPSPIAPAEGPPPVATAPAPPSTAEPATALSVGKQAEPPAAARKPVYKRWWLWTIVGVVAAGAAVGAAIAITQSAPSTPSVPTELGNYRF
jgi:tetratricopeptide (TPR) repeat protein